LTLKANGGIDPNEEFTVAAWQTLQTNVPERCVVRCDGDIQNAASVSEAGAVGVPCGVISVEYAIGGLNREVLVDAVKQSALPVMAESVQTRVIWDRRRIERLAAFYANLAGEEETPNPGPCRKQILAASITVADRHGAYADGRWLDIISYAGEAETPVISSHPIPQMARKVRFTNSVDTDGSILKIEDYLSRVWWSNSAGDTIDSDVIHIEDNECITCGCALDVPAGVSWLHVELTNATVTNLARPFWAEWILGESSL
jgi:hypothetical protein